MPKGSCDNTLVRRVLRRFLKTLPGRVLRRGIAMDFLREKGSQKGFLEGVVKVPRRQKHTLSESTTP